MLFAPFRNTISTLYMYCHIPAMIEIANCFAGVRGPRHDLFEEEGMYAHLDLYLQWKII